MSQGDYFPMRLHNMGTEKLLAVFLAIALLQEPWAPLNTISLHEIARPMGSLKNNLSSEIM